MKAFFKDDDTVCIYNDDDEEECFSKNKQIENKKDDHKFQCDGETDCIISSSDFEFFCEKGIKKIYTDCKINSPLHGKKIGSDMIKYDCNSKKDIKLPDLSDVFICESSDRNKINNEQVISNTQSIGMNEKRIDDILPSSHQTEYYLA
tara:strand:+ start:15 stop:458 length:444 start_codon:yes stop_codon:yes gene_type:complete